MRDRSPELCDVSVVHQPGARAARAQCQRGEVRLDGDDAAEDARRGSRTPASGSSRREADEADDGAGRLQRRAAGWAVQAGSLPLLTGIRDSGFGIRERDSGFGPRPLTRSRAFSSAVDAFTASMLAAPQPIEEPNTPGKRHHSAEQDEIEPNHDPSASVRAIPP